MSAPNPVPAFFDLSEDRWRYADEPERAAAGAGFLALRRDVTEGPFTPTITVTGEMRADTVDPADIGDTAAEQVSGTVVERRLAGSDAAPGLTQRVDFVLDTERGRLNLVQIQVVVTARDESGEETGALVYLLVLTALPRQVASVLEDFQTFVASFRVGDPQRLAES